MFGAIKSLFLFILAAGLALALLHVFHGDPFAVVNWVLHKIWLAINDVAKIFEHNKTFRHAASQNSGKVSAHHK